MKRLAIVFIAFVLGFSPLFASNPNNTPIHSESPLRSQIATLLESPEITLEQEDLEANIEFILNNVGEIVVLTVDADDEMIREYVKSRLNYQRVTSSIPQLENKIFKISLKIVKS